MNAVSATELKRVQLGEVPSRRACVVRRSDRGHATLGDRTCHRYNPGGGACSYLVRSLPRRGVHHRVRSVQHRSIAVVDARRQAQDRFRAERDWNAARGERSVRAAAVAVRPERRWRRCASSRSVQAPAPAPAVATTRTATAKRRVPEGQARQSGATGGRAPGGGARRTSTEHGSPGTGDRSATRRRSLWGDVQVSSASSTS